MYNQRLKVFLVLSVLAIGGVAARLCQLQVGRAEGYRRDIEQALQVSELLPGSRGQILDRHDRILALDEPCFDLCMDFGMMSADDTWTRQQRRAIRRRLAVEQESLNLTEAELTELASNELERRIQAARALADEVAKLDGSDLDSTTKRICARVMRVHESVGGPIREEKLAHPVVAGLDDTAAVAIKSRLDETIGLSVRPSRRRLYPYKDIGCHIVGITGPVTADDLDLPGDTAELADWQRRLLEGAWRSDRVGRSGTERLAEDRLRPVMGYRRVNSRTGAVLDETPATDGQDVRLSLDVALQAEVMKLFEPGQTGSAVVLDVRTGQVLAMVSLPTYDLNRFRQDYAKFEPGKPYHQGDPGPPPLWLFTPQLHRAVAGLYPPGSTAKVVAALGALTDGVVYPGTRFNCRGYLHNPDEFKCWILKSGGAHNDLDLVDAIAHSCNVYFYHVGEAMGAARVSGWLRRFGMSAPPGTGLSEEVGGMVRTPEGPAECRLEAIGQGPVAVSPLHVANVMACIARGGELLPATLMLDGPGYAKWEGGSLGIAPMHLDMVRQGMYRVCNQPGATAYTRFHSPDIEPLDFEIAGKTGTADPGKPLRMDSDGDGELTEADFTRRGDMVWFAGFAPYDNPQVAVAVVVEYVEDGGGAKDAAPIARETLRLCRKMGYIR